LITGLSWIIFSIIQNSGQEPASDSTTIPQAESDDSPRRRTSHHPDHSFKLPPFAGCVDPNNLPQEQRENAIKTLFSLDKEVKKRGYFQITNEAKAQSLYTDIVGKFPRGGMKIEYIKGFLLLSVENDDDYDDIYGEHGSSGVHGGEGDGSSLAERLRARRIDCRANGELVDAARMRRRPRFSQVSVWPWHLDAGRSL